VEVGDSIRLGRVLALKSGGEFSVGKPYLEGVAVEATILEEFRGPKVGVGQIKWACVGACGGKRLQGCGGGGDGPEAFRGPAVGAGLVGKCVGGVLG
jgi:hypothetical protein